MLTKIIAAIVFSIPALASQSINLIGQATASYVTPGGFPSVTNWRVEGQIDTYTTTGTSVGVWGFDSFSAIYIDSGGYLQVQSWGCADYSLPLGSITAFRFSARRDTVSGFCTLDIWDEMTGTHTTTQTAVTTGGAVAFAGRTFAIGSLPQPQQLHAHMGMIRWYSSAGVRGVVPPRLITSSFADLMDYEFEGNQNDSSGRGLMLTFTSPCSVSPSPCPTYVTTEVLPPVPVLSPIGVYTLNGGYVSSTIVGVPFPYDASDSFSNGDTGSVTCAYTQTSGSTVTFSAPSSCITTGTPSAFGTAVVRLTVTDTGGSAFIDTKLGGVIANATTGVVNVAAEANSYTSDGAKIATVLGPMQAISKNQWSWSINRLFALTNLAMYNTTPAGVYPNLWDTPATGTVAITDTVPAVLVGTGTHFQTDVCGGPGNTVPVSTTSLIVPWYHAANPAYSLGRWNVSAATCTDDTHLVLTAGYPWRPTPYGSCSPNIDCGLTYSIGDIAKWGNWFGSRSPGNYYDNTMACYEGWFASGIDDFRDCARAIGRSFWIGFANQWDAYYIGSGTYSTQPREANLEGIMVYGYEAGVDVWPGLRQILYYAAGGSPPTGGSFWWNLYETQFALDYKVSLGDMRENAKMLGGLALAYLLDTDSTVRTHALEALDGTLNGMWIPGIRQHKWSGTNVQPGQDPCSTGYQVVGNQAGTVYATVTNGSANVSIHGTCYQVGAGSITVSGTSVTGDSNTAFTHTFKTGDTLTVTTTSGAETKAISSITNDHAMVTAAFTGTATLAGYYTNGLTEYNVGLAGGDPIPVWFCSTCFGNNQFGNNGIRLIAENSDLDGDAVAYYVSAITNQTNIVLATPYVDAACNSGCNKVMEIARTAGVGAIDYMSAMMAGVLASWVYQAFVMAGPSYAADAAATKTLVQDFAIGIPSSYKNDAGDVWGATIFPGCILFPTSDNCIGANLISGEFLKAMSAIYAIAPTPALKTLGDNGNNYLWGRPDWTRPAGIPLNGPCSPFTNCYLWEATDNSEGLGGFMITYGAAETAKWFGYYWGYGFGLSWPAVRELSPPIITTGGKILTKGKSVIH